MITDDHQMCRPEIHKQRIRPHMRACARAHNRRTTNLLDMKAHHWSRVSQKKKGSKRWRLGLAIKSTHTDWGALRHETSSLKGREGT